MLLNLSGVHGPFFTRDPAILTDSDGRTGVGEMPGGGIVTRKLKVCAPRPPASRSAKASRTRFSSRRCSVISWPTEASPTFRRSAMEFLRNFFCIVCNRLGLAGRFGINETLGFFLPGS
jgi:hypothetical protein